MRWYRGPEGDQRIWYEPDEIEQIVDDELARAGLTPRPSAPVTDLERFIESHLKADLDQYAELPPDVLGLTRFVPGRPAAISINADLTGVVDDSEHATQGLRGRWRATFAHEASHVLLHRYLFEPDFNQVPLFDHPATPAPAGGLMRCLQRDITPVAHDWREVQANRGMAALLMPRMTFRRVTFQRIAAAGLTAVTAGSTAAKALAADLAATFAVSVQAATIRLEHLGLVSRADQLLG